MTKASATPRPPCLRSSSPEAARVAPVPDLAFPLHGGDLRSNRTPRPEDLLLACLTTALIYPVRVFRDSSIIKPEPFYFLNLRNLLLVWLLAVLLFGPRER